MTAHQTVKREYPDAASINGKLYSIEPGPTSVTVAKMLRVLFPDVVTILDLTWGDGGFWDRSVLNTLQVYGNDINQGKSCVYHEDFTDMSAEASNESFDLVAFDPPYQTDVGKEKGSRMSDKYGHYANLEELYGAVVDGTREAWRIARIGILVKVQDYIHASKYVEMTDWVRGAVPERPYQIVHQVRPGKQEDPAWDSKDSTQLSAYAIGSTYLEFRKGNQTHKRRKPDAAVIGKQTASSAQQASNGLIELTGKRRRVMAVEG